MKKILLFILIGLASCSTNLDQKDFVTAEIYKKTKVESFTETIIEYDFNGEIESKKLHKTTIIDRKGLVIKEIKPNMTKTISTENDNLIQNDYLIGYDTTIYEYDSKNLKIRETYKPVYGGYDKNIWTYDKYGNEITNCWLSSDMENCCFYKSYEYDANNRIISLKDSAGPCANRRRLGADNIKRVFKYDSHNNVIANGVCNYEYEYNGEKIIKITENNLLTYSTNVKEFNNEGLLLNDRVFYNNKLSYEFYYMYDDKQLLIEKKELEKGKLTRVYKYEYKFY